jgi:predicted unusual protein kinase regulating ubiquinone biosynthesis (AarF/ABC1/UbiB family)
LHRTDAAGALMPALSQRFFDYLKEIFPLELDFKREATAMTKLRAALRHRVDVLAPEVVAELSTERLLVMECIAGIKVTDRLVQPGPRHHHTPDALHLSTPSMR